MFVNDNLKQHLETSSSINSQPLVIAEWNMNIADNISTIGNYRYRPTASPDSEDFVYSNIPNYFDNNDASNTIKFYTGATDADVVIDGGLDNDDQPIAFTKPNEKERLLYSLEDCFRRFRPRSGINKLRYFEDNYTHFVNNDLANRPRYYMASRNDSFKYWTSYRKESGNQRGIANNLVGALNYIDDAAPFVVYKKEIPANRIVVKMQTNVGNVDLGPFVSGSSSFDDPFYGEDNKTVPTNWKIQILKGTSWVDAISFNPLSLRTDGSPIIASDGYVEIAYGLKVPSQYADIFFVGKHPFASLLPVNPSINSAFFVQENDNELGEIYVWNGESYESFVPEYEWQVISEEISEQTNFVKQFINPEYFIDSVTGQQKYKEFEYIKGIRVVVQTMNKKNSTFDLIELSPRLTCDITDRVVDFQFNKSASDLGVSGMPVGQLLASNGSLNIFDFDDSFNKNNTNSILSSFTNNNLQVKLFEIIYDFSQNGAAYYVPLKTLYSDGFPQASNDTRKFSLSLRDLFFYFETLNAPQLLVENASLSYAVSFLLDSLGFSNYSFKRVEGEDDPIIPYFFVKPETSVAKVLQDLAIATQTAMFFDEFNNFIMMSKNYIMPSETERITDLELIGSLDQSKVGINENASTNTKLANIAELSTKNQEVFNDGRITYSEKYIAKTYGSLKQASLINQDKNWIYKPTLLWEVAGSPPLRAIDDDQASQSSYVLSAIPLNSDLSDQPPFVQNNELQNNVIDFGEGAYWAARYNGYFYANGEIIKYDAIEHNVSGIGNVWISSLREYQNYFSKIQFGGKIYPTGRIRIYAEPFYENIDGIVVMKNGAVNKHGRAQFGTSITYHNAGLSQYWSDTTINAPVQGIEMDSKYLFSQFPNRTLTGVYNQKPISIDVDVDIQEPSNINDMVYAQSKWVAVGSDGIFRTSTDGETWTIYTEEDIEDSFVFSSVAYGNGKWIAAGYKVVGPYNVAAMASSTDGEDWAELPIQFDSDIIHQIVYKNDTWVAVGNNGLVITSTDGSAWTQKTPRLDFSIFGTNKSKILSSTVQETGIRISKIQKGNPGTIVKSKHGLRENDEIQLSTTGSLPSELNTTDWYYVKYINLDSFQLKATKTGSPININTNGSGNHSYKKKAATFVIKSHSLSDGQKIKFIASGSLPSVLSEGVQYTTRVIDKDRVHLYKINAEEFTVTIDNPAVFTNNDHGLSDNDRIILSTTGALPTGLETNKVYYVNKITNNTFSVSEEPDGTEVTTSGSQSGTHSYTRYASDFSGDLILYSTSQTGSTHKVERFSDSPIYSVEYGAATWVIGGESGVFATSSDLNTWQAYETGMKKASIITILYENSLWMLAGTSGKLQRSSNLTKWTGVDTKVGSNITTVAFGGGTWMVAGENGKLSTSTDLSKWKQRDPKFQIGRISKLEYSGYWLAVGNSLKISKSTNNGETWSDKSQENVGELFFSTIIPHNLTPFDTIKLTTTGELSNNPGQAFTITVGTPALFECKGHKLETNDKVKLATTGTLPTGLNTTTIYYVIKVDKDKFRLATQANGSAIAATGAHTGTHTVIFNPIVAGSVYYVTPKNISEYGFTIADNRADARLGITFKGRGYQSGEHKVELYTVPETEIVSSLAEQSVTVSSNTYNTVRINLANTSSFGVNDRIFLATRNSVGGYVEKKISYGLTRYAPFYVSQVQSGYIIVSDQYNGNPVRSSGTVVSLAAGETIVVIRNLTDEIIKSTLLSPSTINFEIGNLLEVTDGDGELVSPTRVASIRQKAQIQKNVTISIASTAIITCNNHGLFDNDIVTFTTTGTLPFGIDDGLAYLVNKINDNSFSLKDPFTLESVETREGVDPNAEVKDEDDPVVTYRTQSGTHSFVKSFNDINRLVLDRKVGTDLPQYLITTEEILIDAEDGETRTETYYDNISYDNEIVAISELQVTVDGKAGVSETNKQLARSATRNGVIKNYLTKSSFSETDVNKFLSTQSGTIQSSALVFNGPSFEFETGVNARRPIDFVSYLHKPLDNKFTHFGTRMRIIGRIGQEEAQQIIYNSLNYFLNPEQTLDEQFSIFGGSGGLAVMVNPETNIGYYFEIIALSQSNIAEYSDDVGLFNVVFYKVVRKVANEGEPETTDSSKAIPVKLWQGVTNIVADDGTMVGQFRMANESTPSVYDLSVEYEDIDENTRKFYLLINNKIIAIVDDKDPLPTYNNMALFVRGGTRAMFENVYAIANNYSQNTVFELDAPINSVFGPEKIDVSQSFRKYALSGSVQAAYLAGIGTSDVPKYNIYFEEFGTIMRECAYFNVRYDKAYPALYAKIAETFNKMKGYTVSGFVPSAYGAEFLVFNNTDTALNLDETTGNYLRILGVSFTQSADKELTVDDYFERVSNFSDPDITEDGLIVSPLKAKQEYLDIKNSRLTYGKKEFNISSPYIQNQDEANNLMSWIISKIMKPRKSVGLKIFAMPILQLGDIVSINYQSNDGIEQVSLDDSRFVVYNIEYRRNSAGPSMNVYLSEVI